MAKVFKSKFGAFRTLVERRKAHTKFRPKMPYKYKVGRLGDIRR